ncbi:MAG: Hsp33 family molecular chaperone HslO [Bdellovibrionales bacterium]|nr:Hsp33 family molecular chaperone HslO [Bdellovibrionales bacterium]
MANSVQKAEKVHRFLSKDGLIRVSAVIAPELILEVQKINAMSPLAVIAAGRATIACILLASHQKDDRVSLLFDGNGPIGKIFVESSYDGKTRAYVTNPAVHLEFKEDKFDVSGAVGIGLLHVTQISKLQKTPYRGTVIIKTGEIGSDIAFYLEQSHQIPSIVALGISVDKNGMVNSAGGVLVELMPGHTDATIVKLEKNVANAKGVSEMIADGYDAKKLVKEYLGDIEVDEISHDYPLTYSCSCSEDRVKNSLMLLGEKEVEDLSNNEDPTEIRCDFCGKKYYFSSIELKELIKDIQKKAMH